MPMHDHDRREAATRYTNAGAAFTLLAAVFFIGGTVSFGAALEKDSSATTYAVAATPVVAGSFSAGVAYVSRRRAAALRRVETAGMEGEGEAAGRHPPPAA